ncbi:hypothetical protein M404DRAFT_27229 [Pisolithus tinctorius Marx 270]|uniref:Uncharacterized protein n=1 Tax=Pisolithus tinctorius Marx 270 TaxID=870435 RepID=A0A0C3K0Y6_PISTI|nr:hypothetical protein M404DRAFT_27229 [Pisolithus tinctorius Marx 270]
MPLQRSWMAMRTSDIRRCCTSTLLIDIVLDHQDNNQSDAAVSVNILPFSPSELRVMHSFA